MTARRLYVPEAMPSRDANGRAVLAKLRFYEPGSALDTLKTVYSDDSLTTPLSQPIFSNSAGQFPEIWADDAERFDVAWSDQAFGRQLGTWENVAPATYVASQTDLDTKLNTDLSNLGATAAVYHGALRIGDQSGWAETTYPHTEAISQLISVAQGGVAGDNRSVGVLGATRSSDLAITGAMGCIGSYGLALNDNTTNVQIAYAGYMEATRLAGAGRTHGLEAAIINKGDVGVITPHDASTTALTAGLWVSVGRPDVGTVANASVALGIIDNGAKFEKGIVFSENVLDSNIALATSYSHKWSWYLNGAAASEIAGNHLWGYVESNTAATAYAQHFLKSRPSSAATQSGDVLGLTLYRGWYGADFTTLSYIKSAQTGAWSTSNAAASLEMGVANGDGGNTAMLISPLYFGPVTGADNLTALGGSSQRFSNAYAKQLRPGDGTPIWTSGAGSPAGVVAAPVGSLYTRTDGGTSTTLYVKETGASTSSGWVAK